MGLLDHGRCRDTEAALRGRISDLEDREERLLEMIQELQKEGRDREREWVERYTTLLNPAASRLGAINHRTMHEPAPAPVAAPPIPDALDLNPDLLPADIAPAKNYPDRSKPTRPMPILTPADAGFRPGRAQGPVRIPVQTIPAPAVNEDGDGRIAGGLILEKE